jgi:hypothetical protein
MADLERTVVPSGATGPAGAAPAGMAADRGEAAVLAAGLVQLAQANTVEVPLPGALKRVVVHTQSDTLYDLPDGTEGLAAHQSNGNLTLAFPNGGIVEFSGFADTIGVRFHALDKGTMDAGRFLHDMQHRGPATQADNHPTFAPGPSPEILGGLTPQGALAPAELIAAPAALHGVVPAGDHGGISPRLDPADVLTLDPLHNQWFAGLADGHVPPAPGGDAGPPGGQTDPNALLSLLHLHAMGG